MDAREQRIAQHYTPGNLEQALLAALAKSGANVDALMPDDLAGADEFHIGGRAATVAFAERLPVQPGQHLLDVGCGIGGPSRYFAHHCGCRVAGVDLSAEFVTLAQHLAERMRLADRLSYRQGSALALPFEDAAFDGAYMMHVGMNVEDKPRLFREVRRVLKPGGFFGIYDVMRWADGELAWPQPWAASPELSFLATPAEYVQALRAAGFETDTPLSRREVGLEFFQAMRRRLAETGGPPPLGPHLVMGASAPQKLANIAAATEQGLLAPTEIIARLN